MRVVPVFVLSALLAVALSAPRAQAPLDQAAEIRRVLSGTFEKADAPLSLDPIVVEGDAAIVGWIQRELAGRAFLRKTSGQWAIAACGGDALKASATLQRLGLPPEQADRLASSLATAEARVDPQRLARFAAFGEIVEMGGQPHAPAPHQR